MGPDEVHAKKIERLLDKGSRELVWVGNVPAQCTQDVGSDRVRFADAGDELHVPPTVQPLLGKSLKPDIAQQHV